MDGNGRWAKKRHLPRVEGHRRGVAALHNLTEAAARAGVGALTVFAFSSENWARPAAEVSALMSLFAQALKRWEAPLQQANVRLRVVGDKTAFSPALNEAIAHCENATAAGTGMTLNVAANYGGRWDICQAAQKAAAAGEVTPEAIARHLSVPEVDLLIRTGGESRISNFLLWQCAYAEIYFTDRLWPDYRAEDLHEALNWYLGRERRFGRISEQL